MKYFETYKEVKELKLFNVRGHLRNIALSGLSVIDRVKSYEKELSRPRVQFLYVHHVFKDEEEKFDLLLKKLLADHTFISYSDAVEKVLKREIDKPYITISSDDGFKNNIRVAEILNRYAAKACFFINPSIIEENNYERIKRYCKEKLNFPPVEFLNWKEIEQLQKMAHEIGSHTMNHINVAETPVEVLKADIEKSYEILKTKCGDVKHFAFPYGKFFHFSEAGRKTVFNAGFISCATAERGCHINHDRALSRNELCILRDHLILDWDINHILHFIINNSRKASINNNLFPYSKQ